jgi:hypothetical protein
MIEAARLGFVFEFLEPLGGGNLRKMPNSGRTARPGRVKEIEVIGRSISRPHQ